MDGPGLSIFQGGESLHLNTSDQREEEEELLKDEKIRKAELQDLIDNAFSDLDDDDIDTDSSISSSRCSQPPINDYSQVDHLRSSNARFSSGDSNCLRAYHPGSLQPGKDSYSDYPVPHHRPPLHGPPYLGDFPESNHVSAHKNHCFHSNPSPIPEYDETGIYEKTDLNGTDQLQVLYEVRLREIERLTKELAAEKDERIQVQRKLAVSEHDKKNLEISLNANRTLLAESREKITQLENEISSLNAKVKETEKSKNEIRSELEITKTQLYHEQQKFAALERSDLNAKREKQLDLAIETLKTRHRAELNDLQQQLQSALDRIEKKDEDYHNLEKKLVELEQKHSEHLLDKCDSVMRQESTFKALLDEANHEKLELTRQINTLKGECTILRSDLEQYDSFRALRLNDNSSSDEKENDSHSMMNGIWRPDSKRKSLNMNHIDLANKLKDELHRALIGQRTKRNEIMKLQEQVQTKEVQIKNLKETEQQYLLLIDSMKAEMNKLLEKSDKRKSNEGEDGHLLAKLQSDIIDLEKENSFKSQKILALENEVKVLKEKLISSVDASKSGRGDLANLYEKKLAEAKNDFEVCLKDKELEWGREMEKIMSECDEGKKLYLDMKNKKDEASRKLAEVSELLEEVKKEKENLAKQLSQKEGDIRRLEEQITAMERDITSKENSAHKELNEIVEKQMAEINMLKCKLEDSSETDEELLRLKAEISNSKSRYLQLEETLRVEFQGSLVKLQAENNLLKDALKKKETELSLRKMCAETQRKDASIETDDPLIIERLDQQNTAEIDRLEKEIERLRTLDESKSQEILRLSSNIQQRINEEVQRLEKALLSRHQEEVASAERRMKELSMKYFTEEMEKLQKQHADNLKSIRDEDYKKCAELQKVLARKEEEIKGLNAKKEQLEISVKKFEEERARAAQIMSQWAKEVELVKQEKEKLEENLVDLKMTHQQILDAYDEMKTKLKETKKAALVYKRRLNEVKTSLSEKYKKLMIDLQKKVNDLVSAREEEIREKLLHIENEYKTKEKLLRLDCKSTDIT